MGGAVSSGRDNDELIDNLMGANYIRTKSVEEVFRALDRAEYMTRDARDQAYKDLAWRSGSLHMSAPCIYSEVMENLELRPGLSFLNVGSGTGYLSTLVGLMLGSQGINHGVEVRRSVLEYSNKRLSQFLENSPTLDEFDFCEPKFYLGNGLCLAPLATPYDRVYCGAACPTEYENYFKQLIKVGGILVMPLDENLVQVKRLGEAEWSSRTVLNVSFATLLVPTKAQAADLVKLDEQTPVRLQVMARAVIRGAMRAGLRRRHPELRAAPARPPPAKKACPRRICIPIDDESDVEGIGALHDLYRDTGAHEMNALLSFMLSMGHNRVAGALRFDTNDSSDSEPDSAPADDDDDDGGNGGNGGGGGVNIDAGAREGDSDNAQREEREERRGRCPLITLDLRDMLAAPIELAEHAERADTDDVRMDSPAAEQQPENSEQQISPEEATRGSASSDGDKSPEKLDRDDSGEGSSRRSSGDSGDRDRRASGDDKKRQDKSSGESSKGRSRKGSGENSKDRRSGEGSRRSERRGRGERGEGDDSDGENPEVPAEVEILLGKTSSDEPSTSKWSMEWEEGAALESSDEEAPRQKLDSGLGDDTSPQDSPAADRTESDGSRPSDSLTDDVDDVRLAGRRRVRRRAAASGARSAPSSAESSPDAAQLRRNKRRAASGGDARRVRLSVLMKRGVKELPLPHALKKFVNLNRCYEF